MRRSMLFAVQVLILSSLPVQAGGICKSGEYFSDYNQRCEKSVLQIGAGDVIESQTIDQLKSRWPVTRLTLSKSPAYGEADKKIRSYEGVRLRDVLASLLPAGESIDNYVLAVTCLDGFDPVLKPAILNKLKTSEALIAYRQTGISVGPGVSKDGLWDLVSAPWGIVSPGPFYLVWSDPSGTYWEGWPFQIKSLRLIPTKKYNEMLAKIEPDPAFMKKNPKSDVESGYDQFRGKCIICHTLNGFGGKKARGDLMSIFKQLKQPGEAEALIDAMIKNPPDGMKDILDVKFSPADINHLAEYLRHMGQRAN